jgi:signal peptidase I
MRSQTRRRFGLHDIVSILLGAAVVLTVRSSLADHYHVPSGSMLPSLHEGDRIAVEKCAYSLRLPLTHLRVARYEQPSRGDMVVLESPESGIVLVKRVVAVGGDLVAVRQGRISLNGTPVPIQRNDGELLEELGPIPHVVHIGDGGPDFGPALVPADHVLVMGDNRGNSHDGRSFGFVPVDAVLGRVMGVFVREGSPTWVTP